MPDIESPLREIHLPQLVGNRMISRLQGGPTEPPPGRVNLCLDVLARFLEVANTPDPILFELDVCHELRAAEERGWGHPGHKGQSTRVIPFPQFNASTRIREPDSRHLRCQRSFPFRG